MQLLRGDSINLEQPNSKTRRGRVGKNIANTLTCSCNQGVVVEMNDGFVNRKYEDFYNENGYIPEMFNPYNCSEINNHSPTITTQCGSTTSSSSVLIKEDNVKNNKIIMELIPQQVRVRKYEVDIEGLKEVLKIHKKNSKLTINEMAIKLNKPKTLVEHWFRSDNCFSIPDEDIWYQLKDLLNIETNKFDESITTFEIRDGVYEKSNRVYDANEIAMCLMAQPVGNAGGFSYLYKLDNNNKGVDVMWKNNLEKFNFEMEEIRIFDIFAGIGSLHQSLKELGVPVRVTNLSEVDIDATISYAGGHIDNFKDLEFEYPPVEEMRQWLIDRNIGYSFEKGKSSVPRMKVEKLKLAYKANVLLNNLGDISKIDYNKIEDFDLMNMSFCCQDLSGAGKQKGMKNEDGTPTRSGLYVYSIESVRVKKPKYIMIENVKALIQKKFIDDFYSIISELEEMGYNCYYPTKQDKKGNISPTCLNSKDFGIAQNRERIFVIAIRKDIDNKTFEFPVGKDYGIRLKDMLEDQVDEKYYLSDEIQNRFKLNGKNDSNRNDINTVGTSAPECRTIGQRDVTYGVNGIMSTLTATDYKQPKQILDVQNGAIRGRYNSEGKIEQQLELRDDGLTNTLTTVEKDNIVIENTSCVNRIGGCFDTEKSTHQAGSVYNDECLSPTLDTMQGGYRQPCVIDDKYYLSDNMKKYILDVNEVQEGTKWEGRANNDVLNPNIAHTLSVRGAGGGQRAGVSNFIIDDYEKEINVKTIKEENEDVTKLKIRKLTPLECWRLQGFDDSDFYKAQELGISDSQLYKQSGNSITVNVLYHIFKNLFKEYIVE